VEERRGEMGKIEINPKVDNDFRVAKPSNIGFEVDREGNLYLIHGEGISEIKVAYGNALTTSTWRFEANKRETKPLPKGTKIEITI